MSVIVYCLEGLFIRLFVCFDYEFSKILRSGYTRHKVQCSDYDS